MQTPSTVRARQQKLARIQLVARVRVAYEHLRDLAYRSGRHAANDPAIQSLVRGTPDRFHADERSRRAAAGFAVGSAVFRIAGAPGVDGELALLKPTTMLVSSVGEQTVCLLALEPGRVPEFGRAVRDLAARDIVSRVEAEPHL